jgi:hypothetical protein
MTLPSRRRALGAVAALVLAGALGLSPQATHTALAAGTLRVAAAALYELDPDAGRVHVEIDVTATSLKPNSGDFVYFYRTIGFPLQAEASGIRVSGGASSIATTKRDGFIEAVVRLRGNLYYQETTRFTIRYDLVGGAPRSSSPTRVGKAFSTFGVWAWGDPGLGSVEVRTPPGVINHVYGSLLSGGLVDGAARLRAEPADPSDFFAIVESEDRDAYSQTRVSFAGGVEIVVLAWPEDDAWEALVSDTLRKGIPELRELIALPWPVDHDLNVRQRYTPSLEGFAGVFFTDDERIDVSEDLDPVVIVHEASHAWFNGRLFAYRWIYEGLAQEYAWRVQDAVGGDNVVPPDAPDKRDEGAVALNVWTFPEVIRDDTDDTEIYGYDASFWLMHRIVETAGLDQMRDAFAKAHGDLTAYPGVGTPETVASEDDWRRLLDLTQPLDEPDPEPVIQAVREYVLGDISVSELTDRTHARDDYRALLANGDGWIPPWYVREPMGAWLFREATPRMAEATTVLAKRDEVVTAAGALGLHPDDALRTAYEGAEDGFAGAVAVADDELAALRAITDARAKVDAEPDVIAQIGLLGETPRVPYEASRAAFESGRLAEAQHLAETATSAIVGAPAAGQARIVATLAVVLGLIVLLLLVRLVHRRRRRHALAHATATLAADPAAPPALPSETVPEDSGATTAVTHAPTTDPTSQA